MQRSYVLNQKLIRHVPVFCGSALGTPDNQFSSAQKEQPTEMFHAALATELLHRLCHARLLLPPSSAKKGIICGHDYCYYYYPAENGSSGNAATPPPVRALLKSHWTWSWESSISIDRLRSIFTEAVWPWNRDRVVESHLTWRGWPMDGSSFWGVTFGVEFGVAAVLAPRRGRSRWEMSTLLTPTFSTGDRSCAKLTVLTSGRIYC